jgi:hypothetical protein
VAIDPADPGAELLAFLSERHLATLTTLRPDGPPHGKDPRAPLPSHARAGTLHGAPYRQPREDPARVAIEISVDRILGST